MGWLRGRSFVSYRWLVAVLFVAVICAAVAGAARSEGEPFPTAGGSVVAGGGSAGGAGGVASASSSFGFALPSTPLRDDFNRPDGGLGSDWASFYVPGVLSIQGGVVRTLSGQVASSYWVPQQFGPDQEAYHFNDSIRSNLGNIRLFLRLSDSNGVPGMSGYQLILQRVLSGWLWYVWRIDDGNTVYLVNQVNGTDYRDCQIFGVTAVSHVSCR